MTTTLKSTTDASSNGVVDTPIRLTRHRLDLILTGFGALSTVVMLVAGGLLWWGSNFAGNYVTDELKAQNISFPDAAVLSGQGRTDLVGYAGQQLANGDQAQAYASYIAGHIAAVANGATYADLGTPQRAAQAAVDQAVASGAPADEVKALQDKAAAITTQRESIFHGEMLRGTLLNTYAWDTIGQIAGYAALAAFVAGALMLILTVAGMLHLKRPVH